MNRIIAIFILCILPFASRAEAQIIRSVGLKCGAAAASQTWQYTHTFGSLDSKTRWGVDVGAYVEWLDLPLISISSELHYIQRGFQVELPVTTLQFPDGNGTFKTLSPRVDYLSVPILAKCRLDLGSWSVYAVAGPRIDFKVGMKDEGFGLVLDEFRSSEYGVTIGLGCQVNHLLPVGLGAEFRFSPTFQDSYATNLLKVRNRSFEMVLVMSL